MKIPNRKIFRAYDIRGVAYTELTEQLALAVGRVLGSKLDSIVLGRDGRLSSPELAKSLAKGLTQAGCKVYDLGLVSTPLSYFASWHFGIKASAMVTGSHNPKNENGLKITLNNRSLNPSELQQLAQDVENDNFTLKEQQGEVIPKDAFQPYLEFISQTVKISRKLKVIIDCGNGATSAIAPAIYRALGVEVKELFCKVDGNFPNHHPDPSVVSNLQDLINELKTNPEYEIGLAFDGDGDRLGVVSRSGEVIYPDRQMMLFSQEVLKNNQGREVVYDVKSSQLLENFIEKSGGKPTIIRTGHSFMKEEIRSKNAILGGEFSGHISFNDKWPGFDDGVYNGARLLEILAKSESGDIFSTLPKVFSTPEVQLPVVDPHLAMQQILLNKNVLVNLEKPKRVVEVDGLRFEYDYGFFLIRASNTTSILTLRFEADTEANLEKLQNRVHTFLKPYALQG